MRLGDLDALRAQLFSYYSFINEDTQKSTYKGDTLMDYEVADMIEDCIDNAPTIDPVRAAGGCYCRECCFGRKPRAVDMQDGYVYCQEQSKYKEIDSFCSDGEIKEAQDA